MNEKETLIKKISTQKPLSFKAVCLSVFIGILFTGLFSFSVYVFASPPDSAYQSGETLDSSCAPGDTNCTVTTTVTIDNGGTGQTSYTNGQLLIGNTTGNTLTKATLTGTANQITVTNSTGSITLSTPQNIHTSATPQFSRMGIGGTSSTTAGLYLSGAPTAGVDQYGIDVNAPFGSDATTSAQSFISVPATAAAAYTIPNFHHFRANDISLGAGSAVTNQYGFYISDLTGATNNYGIFSNVSSGTDKYNIYASGTAPNYFAGYVGIGAIPVSTQVLTTVVGTATDIGLVVKGAASQSGNLQEWQNSSATVLTNIDPSGRLFLPAGSSGAGNLALSTTGDTNTGFYFSAADEIILQTGGNDRVTFDANGNVGIGISPAYALDVLASGTGIIARFNSDNATGCTLADGGTISCSSDLKLKKNIIDISYGLIDLMKLRPVQYNWKTEDEGSTKSLGFIAQEVEIIIPKLIMTDENGNKQLNTIGMIPVLTKSIQEQQKQIDALFSQLGLMNPDGTIRGGLVAGVDNNSFADKIKSVLASLGITIQGGIINVKDLVAERFNVKTARVERLELIDRATGDIYCTWIENGEWHKERGQCDDDTQSQNSGSQTSGSGGSLESGITTPEPSSPSGSETPSESGLAASSGTTSESSGSTSGESASSTSVPSDSESSSGGVTTPETTTSTSSEIPPESSTVTTPSELGSETPSESGLAASSGTTSESSGSTSESAESPPTESTNSAPTASEQSSPP